MNYISELPIELLDYIFRFLERHQLPKLLLISKSWYQLIQKEFIQTGSLNPFALQYTQNLLKGTQLLSIKDISQKEAYFEANPQARALSPLYNEFLKRKQVRDQSEDIFNFFDAHPDKILSIAKSTHLFFKHRKENEIPLNLLSMSTKILVKFSDLQPLIFRKSVKIFLVLFLTVVIISLFSLYASNEDGFASSKNSFVGSQRFFLNNHLMYTLGPLLCYLAAILHTYEGNEYESYLRQSYLTALQDEVPVPQTKPFI